MVGHARKLSPDQIEAVVDFIRVNFMKFPQVAAATSVGGATPPRRAGLGESVYKKHCSVCHGDNGNTAMWAQSGLNPPPRNFTSVAAKTELTRERMIQSVSQGRPGTAMQPFAKRLARKEIEAVVDYVRVSFMQGEPPRTGAYMQSTQQPSAGAAPEQHRGPHLPDMASSAPVAANGGGAETVAVDMSAPMPNKLKGNAKRGQDFYMKNCFTCHGVKGDGNGPRAYFISPRPRNFTHEQARSVYNRPRLFDAVVNGKRGTPMPAWGKVLTEQQVADVAEFVFQAYIKGSLKLNLPEASAADEDKKKANPT
jgi:mono/diheme cytochrome c family protein